jgi:lambda family phage portal protein
MTAPAGKPRYRGRFTSGGQMMSARFIGDSRSYEAGATTSQELATWNPSLTAANDELGSRDRITARARDLDRNDSIAHGGIDRRVNATVGAEMWVSPRPDWKALGLTLAQGDVLAEQMRAAWNGWANDPWHFNDVQGELTFSQQIRLAYYHVAREEEAVAVLYGSAPQGIRRFATQVRIVDPDLLSTPSGQAETSRLRNGIEMTVHGRPIAYWFQKEHPNATVRDHADVMKWERVPRYTRSGRPQVVHYYSKRRAGVMRGISKLAAGMRRFKQLGRYTDAEINAQLLSAMMPLFLKSKTPETAYEALAPGDDGEPESYTDQRAAYHEASKLTFNGVRIPALFENEELDSRCASGLGPDFWPDL